MPDPLSIAASIISLCQATAKVVSYLKDVHDAPADQTRFLVELSGLDALLHALQDRLKNQKSKPGDQWLNGIQLIAASGGLLEQFKFSIEQLASKLPVEPTSKLKEIGRRFTWRLTKTEIIDILDKIERMKTLASFALANDHFSLSQAIKEDSTMIRDAVSVIQAGVSDIAADNREQEYQRITEWLSPLNFRVAHNDIFQRREEGTGLWLLESEALEKWIAGTWGILWCPGMPGAGKTVLASIVVDYLRKFLQSDHVSVACVYCNYREHGVQTAPNLIASILKQIIQDSSSISDTVRSMYQSHSRMQTRPKLDEYMKALKSEVGRFAKVFVVVDALDECREDDGTRDMFIQELQKLSLDVNLMATSRDLPSIAREFQETDRLFIRAHVQDVRKYIEGRICRASRRHINALRNEIIDTITENSKGMFLLARLHMDSLVTKHNIAAVRNALKSLPKSMDESYDEAMGRIDRQNEDDKAIAKDIFSWITYARRPLSVIEIQHALAVQPDMKKMDPEYITDEEFLVSVCAGLVVVDEERGTIRLVHYTTQQYFERWREHFFPDAQARIVEACLTYLSFDTFENACCKKDKELNILLGNNPLLEYAAVHWGDHVRGPAEPQCEPMVLNFFQNCSSYLCACQVLHIRSGRPKPFCQMFPRDFSGVHMCAFFGLEWIIKREFENGAEANMRDSEKRTPLSYAARNGHLEIVKLFLSRDDVDVNAVDWSSRTPLSWAAAEGREAVVKTLLAYDGIQVDLADRNGRAPLSFAAARGFEALVKILLAWKEVDVNRGDSDGQTPLIWAARSAHEEVVKLLLSQRDIKVNIGDIENRTPLWWAVCRRHEKVTKLLMTRDDVDVNVRDADGRTSLYCAAEDGNEILARLLLERADLEVDPKYMKGMTPLIRAAAEGHWGMTRLLLAQDGVDLNWQDDYGRTALYCAALNGHEEIVKLLLDWDGVKVNTKDEYGWTPLSCVAQEGHEKVVKLLVSRKDVEIVSEDIWGRTPLVWATDQGHEVVARLLMAAGNDCITEVCSVQDTIGTNE